MTDKESFIQLKKDNVFRVGILDKEGNDTGKCLEFDLEDIELPTRLCESQEMHERNMKYLKDQLIIINKREDHKGKKLLSKNEEEKIKMYQKVFKDEMKALDLFLGEGKTQMILDLMGRKPYHSMYQDISEMIKPLMPKLEENFNIIKDKIQKKYSSIETDVLE